MFCQRLICDNDKDFTTKLKWQFITKIEELPNVHTTYCLTENVYHQCVFNNVLTKQCHINHYGLQLSLYMYMILKHNPSLKAGKLTIHHVKFEEAEETDQYGFPIILQENGQPIVKHIEYIEVPYMKREVEIMLKAIK